MGWAAFSGATLSMIDWMSCARVPRTGAATASAPPRRPAPSPFSEGRSFSSSRASPVSSSPPPSPALHNSIASIRLYPARITSSQAWAKSGWRDRKVQALQATRPDVIAAGNVGCAVQIASTAEVPVVHTVELLDWASGGPPPSALAAIIP